MRGDALRKREEGELSAGGACPFRSAALRLFPDCLCPPASVPCAVSSAAAPDIFCPPALHFPRFVSFQVFLSSLRLTGLPSAHLIIPFPSRFLHVKRKGHTRAGHSPENGAQLGHPWPCASLEQLPVSAWSCVLTPCVMEGASSARVEHEASIFQNE